MDIQIYKNEKIYRCNLCNKTYVNRCSLWSHNKKFHTKNTSETIIKPVLSAPIAPNIAPKAPEIAPEINQPSPKNNELICTYCNNIFYKKFNLERHYKICKNKKNINNELQKENNILKSEVEKIKKEKDELASSMEKIVKEQIENMKKHFTDLINKNCRNSN